MATATQRRRKAAQRRYWETKHRTRKPLIEGVSREGFHSPAWRKRHPSMILGSTGSRPVREGDEAFRLPSGPVTITDLKDFQGHYGKPIPEEYPHASVPTVEVERELTYDEVQAYYEERQRLPGIGQMQRSIRPLVVPDKKWVRLKDVDDANDGRITRLLESEPTNTHAATVIYVLGFDTSEASVRRYRKQMASHS